MSQRKLFEVLMKAVVVGLLFYQTLASQSPAATTNSSAKLSTGFCTMGVKSIHDFTVKDIHGNDIVLAQYKGKALLVVNVASQWCFVGVQFVGSWFSVFWHSCRAVQLAGLLESSFSGLTTTNYKELNQLYQQYKDHGFEILAFPCNQFAGQEPGTNQQIVEVACTRFKAEFPIFDKVEVNGANAAPIYKFLKASKGGIFGDSIKWNFTKFLVDKDGRVVDRYAPITSPSKIEKDIKQLLGVV